MNKAARQTHDDHPGESSADVPARGLDPSLADVSAAAERIRGHAVRTPLVRSEELDRLTGARVYLKAEVLQRTGSFKFRGAYNRVANMPAAVRALGLVSFSSGNHAQAIAAAAQAFGVPATIFMPRDAPEVKKARTRRFGATVVEYDRVTEDRDAMCQAHLARRGGTLVHPFEDFDVVAGQGTLGLEVIEDLADRGLVPDDVVVNASGGGLASGVAVAVRALAPSARIVIAEPTGFERFARSFEAGTPVANARLSGTFCDALLAARPGERTFRITRGAEARTTAASDDEVTAAIAFAAGDLKLVVEPGGAAGLAALMSGRLDARGRTVVVVLSGGNVDPAVLARCLAA